MQGRVIKFNLMGAIFVLILIIAIIVAAIVYVPKLINSQKEKNETNNSGVESENTGVSKEIDEEKVYKETVTLNGIEHEIAMKNCKGSFGYSMKYDVERFYVEKDIRGIDYFNSLYSDTIFIHVSEKNAKYEEKVKVLNSNKEANSQEAGVIEYDVTEEDVNGLEAVCETKRRADGVMYTYYIKKDNNSYLVMQIHCGEAFEEMTMPVIEKMMGSLEV